MAKQVDFTRPQKLIAPSFRNALRQHKPSEWASLGFTVRPDGRKHELYYVSLQDLLTWGASLAEMRRRGYNAGEAKRYLWSVYERYTPYIYEFFGDVREGQLEDRVKAFCQANFPEEWLFD